MEIKDIINDARRRMDSAVEDGRKKLAAVRTGRASVSLLDNVRVEYYGTKSPLNQVATLTVVDPRLITVTGSAADVEKSLSRRSSPCSRSTRLNSAPSRKPYALPIWG